MPDFRFAGKCPMPAALAMLLGAMLLLPPAEAQRSGFVVELEGSAAWQSYNDVEIPNDGTATRFCLATRTARRSRRRTPSTPIASPTATICTRGARSSAWVVSLRRFAMRRSRSRRELRPVTRTTFRGAASQVTRRARNGPVDCSHVQPPEANAPGPTHKERVSRGPRTSACAPHTGTARRIPRRRSRSVA